MQTITSKNLRYNMKEVLTAVESGQEYYLTFHKKTVAKLVPIDNPSTKSQNLDNLLASSEFRTRKISKESKEYNNYKELKAEKYSKYDK